MYRQTVLEHIKEGRFFIEDIRSGQSLKGRDLISSLEAIRTLLKKNHVKPLDRICLISQDPLFYILFYIVCVLDRIAINPINPASSLDEVSYAVNAVKPKVVFSYQQLGDIKVEILPESAGDFICNDPLSSNEPLGTDSDWQEGDVFSITLTSGSTGKPKIIAHYVERMLANVSSFNTLVGVSCSTKMYHFMPPYYMAGIHNTLLSPLLAGGSVVIDNTFSPMTTFSFWDNFLKSKANAIWMSPTMLNGIMMAQRDQDHLDAIRSNSSNYSFFVGTAPLKTEHKQAFFDRYGINAQESYGLSETLFVSVKEKCNNLFNGSVGTVLDGTGLRISSTGEIILDGHYMMKGYLQEEGSFILPSGNQFYTGDKGKVDERELFVVGRISEVIIKGGENIDPVRIENLILDCPGVDSVAVFGYEDPMYGQNIACCVQGRITKKELSAFCDKILKKAERPEKYILVESMPLGPTGKVQKAKLQATLAGSFI